MHCPNQYEWELFLDGEMTPARQEAYKIHLEGCPACGRVVAALRQESELFAAALAATPLPSDLAAEIKRRVVTSGDPGGWWLRFLLPASSLAGMLVGLSIGWPLFEKLRAILNLLGFGDLVLQLAIVTAGVMGRLAESAIRGKPVMPALTVFVLCVLWMQLKVKKGGRAHV